MMLGTAQKPESVRQYFKRPFTEHQAVVLQAGFQDLKYQFARAQFLCVSNLLGVSNGQQFFGRHVLQFSER